MKRPGGLGGLVGQPIVTLAVMGVGGYCLYLWLTQPGTTFLGLAALWVMVWTLNANGRVADYKAWKRSWDGMAPDARRPISDHPIIRVGALVIMVSGVGLYLYGNYGRAGYPFALAWLVGGLGLMAAIALVRAIRRAAPRLGFDRREQRSHGPAPVTICVSKAVLAVPNLERAYSQLPEHCWRVLGTRSA